MPAPDVMLALEDASVAIARLDARLKASPLKEAWHVRAGCKAAISLAGVDGVQVREADLVGLMVGARLPVADSYLGAGIALAWWRRAMGRIVLSEPTRRLLGQSTTRSRAAVEAQAEFDAEDDLSSAARRAVAQLGEAAPIDAWTDAGARTALEAMRIEGRGLPAIARGLKTALARERDPSHHDRAWDLKRTLADQAEARLELETAGLDEEAIQARRREVQDMLASLSWDGPRALGEAHLAVADRIHETGMTSMRLTILTGATKRVSVEGRGDPRAVHGFLAMLAREAREGAALLDTLEATVARWAVGLGPSIDKRSSLPDVLWGVLVLPAIDAGWLEDALGLSPRVVQKFVHRLATEGYVSHWAERRTEGLDGKAADVRLWVAEGFDTELERNVRSAKAWKRAEQIEGRVFADVLDRAGDVDVSVPMVEVFRRFDGQMVDIDREFGRLWERRPNS